MDRFKDRVALITGAAHGIGRACAQRLSAEGATVIVADIDISAAQQTVSQLTGEAFAVECDVCDKSSIEAAVAHTVASTGRLDVLVNNVGVASGESFAELSTESWHRQLEPTLHGAVQSIQTCIPHLLQAPEGGAVVSISSVNGMAAVGGIAYSAAKAGLINMTQNLAVDYGPRTQATQDSDHGWIRFNVVSPGTIKTRVWTEVDDTKLQLMNRLTKLYPMGRVGEPADIAAAVAFLASQDASWITGVTLPVDGGFLAGPAMHLVRDPS